MIGLFNLLPIPLIFALPFFCDTLNAAADKHPFGDFGETSIPKNVLDSAKGFDYEIDVTETGDMMHPEFSLRIKGVSAYYQRSLDIHVTYIDPIPEDDIISTSPWTLVQAEKMENVKKLVKSFQDYSLEYTTENTYGSSTLIAFYDLKKGTGRIFNFPNIKSTQAKKASEIMDLLDNIR